MQKTQSDLDHLEHLLKSKKKTKQTPKNIEKPNPRLENTSGEVTENMSGFSVFAHQKELQIKQIENIIDKTIRDALYSHFQAIKQQTQREVKILKMHEKYKQQLDNLLDDLDIQKYSQIEKVIADPIKYIHKKLNPKNGFLQASKLLRFLNYVKNYSLVEGKIIKADNLLLTQYMKHQKQIIIPTNFDKQIFIKTGKGTVPSYVFLKGNRFLEKDELNKLNLDERKKIIDMVFLYLTQKGIAIGIEDLNRRVLKVVQKDQ